jgi:uncharacterized protein (TIGR02996 family)
VRTFTYSDAKSHKFWNIELEGKSFTVTYGRIGTKGQTQTKKFPNADKAQTEHDKLVKQKLAKGYVETTPTARTQATPLAETLEAALVENPDDLAAHAAYADYLQEQGDPRGEFIQVQLALEDEGKSTAERKKLQKREKELLKKHDRGWLGELAPFLLDQEGIPENLLKDHQLGEEAPAYAYSFDMRRGWLDRVEGGYISVAFSRALARAPQARLLSRLILKGDDGERPEDLGEHEDAPDEDYVGLGLGLALFPLLRSRYLGNVRHLQIGEQVEGEEYYSCHMDGHAAVGLVKLMPRLERLELLAHGVDTDQLFGLKTLDNLRILQVYHVMHYPLQKLAKNPSLGNLTHLFLCPHNADEGEPILRLDGLKAIVRSMTLTNLTHLRYRMSDAGDGGCREIVKSGILKRLKMLDLHFGCVTDKGARTLAESPDLGELELLDLSGNCLSAAGIRALEKTGVNLVAEGQWESSGDAEDDYQNYLFQGDIE